MAVSEGQIIGSYRVVTLLGQGGMATVYKAYHPKLNRYVALKMIHQSFLSDTQFVARFEREAQIIARLDHPNIVPVHDYAEHEGQPYLVMKYIEGISLKDALADGPLELRDTMMIMAPIAAALDYAHSQHVLHRDIKPSNIMLDKSSTPYLTDFGLARTVQEGESSLSQGLLIGTPAYMSPEQASGLSNLDSRSDLYSLGVVLYELLVGKAPFSGGTTYKILNDHLTAPPPIPSSLNADIPPAVEAVLLKALAKEPDERFQTAADMYKALRSGLIESQVKRLNPGERHSIVVSLSKPRPEGSLAAARDRSKASGSSARSDMPIPGQVVNRREATPALPPPKAESSAGVWLLGGAALMLAVIVVVGLVLLNLPSPQTDTGADVNTLPTLNVTEAPTQIPATAVAALPPTNPPPIVMTAIPDAPQRVGDQPQNPPALPGDLPAFPPGVEPYAVSPLSLEQAEAAVQQDPNNPAAYLALLQAQISARQPPEAIDQTLRQGAQHADPTRYVASIIEMFQTAPVPPDVMFRIYNEMLRNTRGTELHTVIRARMGLRLYELSSRQGIVPSFVVSAIDSMIDNNYDSLFPAMLARLFITHDNLRLAEASLNRAGLDTPEAKLVYADLLAAKGDTAGARQQWEQLASDAAAPDWVRAQAQAMLRQSP